MSESVLTRTAEVLKEKAWADSTTATYATHLKCYASFCEALNYDLVPASSHMIQVYIAYLVTVKAFKYNTIKQYLNILSHIHRMAGIEDPRKGDYHVTQELLGAKRILGVAQTPVDAITPQLLQVIHSTLTWQDTFDYSFWSVCLIAFFGATAAGQCNSPWHFDPTRDLRRVDIVACTWGFMIRLRWTKTIQYREKVAEILLPRLNSDHDSALCPSRALQSFLDRTVWADPLGPWFIADNGEAMTYRAFCAKLQTCLQKGGG